MIKIVFLDIDNTLTSPTTHRIPESAKRAVSLARQRGIKVFTATGRNTMVDYQNAILEGMEFDGYIALNGQLTYLPDRTIIWKQPLDMDDVKAIIELSEKLRHPCLHVGTDYIHITFIDKMVEDFHGSISLPLPPVMPYKGEEIFSLLPYIRACDEEPYRQAVKNCEFTRWNDHGCDVIPKDGGKHRGIEAALEHFGFKAEEAIAFGDGENDASMLRFAGYSLAMSQSSEAVKKAAKDVAEPVDEDGIYKAFIKYGIIEES